MLRLNKLWAVRKVGRWPALSAKTLWEIQWAGLRLPIPKQAVLAELWLRTLERALSIECKTDRGEPSASLLHGFTLPSSDGDRQIERVVVQFSTLDLRRGKLKAGRRDWAAVAAQRELAKHTLVAFGDEGRRRDARLVAESVWKTILNQRRPLPEAVVTEFMLARPERAANILTAAAHHSDPETLSRNLRRYGVTAAQP